MIITQPLRGGALRQAQAPNFKVGALTLVCFSFLFFFNMYLCIGYCWVLVEACGI